jgi:hypothetical protein
MQLPRLRKLVLSHVRWTAEQLAELKQLSELRELSLSRMQPHEIVTLCEPPHSLQLESIDVGATLDAVAMRALLHLPTLTALDHAGFEADGWPLLPELPLLQRLTLWPQHLLTAELTSSLSASLSRCETLTDLSLGYVRFGDAATPEQIQARWSDILRSVPNLRRLHVAEDDSVVSFLAVLPVHLPLLEHLLLVCYDKMSSEDLLARLAHPSVRRIQLVSWNVQFTQEQVRALVRSARLPNLDSITRSF